MAEEALSIKGTKNGLVIIFDPEMDIEEIKTILKLKMEKSNGFFRGAKFTIYNSNSGSPHHFTNELEGICRQYGLVPSGEVLWPPTAQESGQLAHNRKQAQVIPIRQQSQNGEEQSVLVMRTLRSGQRVSSPYNVVVMGDVNPGAEIVSGGSIYVMGSCKGNVHAGHTGNLMTEVMALKLQPVALRIGSIMAGSVSGDDSAGPQAARVQKGKIVIDKVTI